MFIYFGHKNISGNIISEYFPEVLEMFTRNIAHVTAPLWDIDLLYNPSDQGLIQKTYIMRKTGSFRIFLEIYIGTMMSPVKSKRNLNATKASYHH